MADMSVQVLVVSIPTLIGADQGDAEDVGGNSSDVDCEVERNIQHNIERYIQRYRK